MQKTLTNLGPVECSSDFRDPAHTSEKWEKLATWHKLEDHVQVRIVLSEPQQVYKKLHGWYSRHYLVLWIGVFQLKSRY